MQSQKHRNIDYITICLRVKLTKSHKCVTCNSKKNLYQVSVLLQMCWELKIRVPKVRKAAAYPVQYLNIKNITNIQIVRLSLHILCFKQSRKSIQMTAFRILSNPLVINVTGEVKGGSERGAGNSFRTLSLVGNNTKINYGGYTTKSDSWKSNVSILEILAVCLWSF